MRVRRASPLLLLYLSSLASAKDSLSNVDILELNRAAPRNPAAQDNQAGEKLVPEVTTSSVKGIPTRAFKGTEDAPVDGLDGKPHAGPFVDTTPELVKADQAGKAGVATTSSAKSIPTSLEKFAGGAATKDGWNLADIPEKNDGVMNDEHRQAPEKGTTGTEGGVSERTKGRKAKGETERLPKEPKEAPPLPHSEEEHVENDRSKKGKSSASDREVTAQAGKPGKVTDDTPPQKAGDRAAGGFGLQKPKDLPEKPHNIPNPNPKGGKMPSGSDRNDAGPPVDSKGGAKWLTDTMPYTEGRGNQGDSSSVTTAESDWHEWFHSYVLSLTMILFSEIGDKTFLIAALMAMRHPRLVVFSAAFGALIAMTVLSAVLGHAVPTLLPKRWTTLAAAVLFFVFGARMLREGLAMPKDSGVGEEMREVEAELEEQEHSRRRSSTSAYNLESGRGRKDSSEYKGRMGGPSPPSRDQSPSRKLTTMVGLTNLLGLVLSPAWVQTFIMTFLGEWGDRSQIATIAMAAGQDYWWVTLGAITGHAVCTGIAVIGGRALAGRVSMRVVTIGGAVAFLVFGAIYLFETV
nr:GDT1-like protein 1, chloroplastic [Quercus suber]